MNRKLPRGLDAQHIKLLALIAMTLDHLAVFGASWPPLSHALFLLRAVGRISAPLFLFLLTFSVDHTRSRARLVLRLYLAGVLDGLVCLALTFLSAGRLPPLPAPGIFHTLAYTALFCTLADALTAADRSRSSRRILLLPAIFAALVPTVLDLLGRHGFLPALYSGNSAAARILQSVFPSMLRVDYGPAFILLGLVMFLARTKQRRIAVFTVFTALCAAVRLLVPSRAGWSPLLAQYFVPLQLCMVLAVPVMLLYNEQRGSGGRWFFYVYYPLHRAALWLLFAWLRML